MFYDKLLEYFTERGLSINNTMWDTEHTFHEERNFFARLCCRKKVNESISVSAQLTKPLYFQDETIQLDITIDNTESKRSIDEIEVTLRQIISVNIDGKNQY